MVVAAEKKVFKKVLGNGLTVLVRPNHIVPKVSLQLWYNVGSKDEKTGEKGLAHLIEHMIFKGTKTLSESDINMITHKLSGSCNAFTSYDYTGYLFDFPSHHWQEALPIMADCMRNCTFKEEFLASEMKAVIQELKMYRDNYASSLIEEMISTMFVDHPYHYPIIGFKQDLWSLKRDALINFYKKHYIPNNATLVIVGDVQPEEVFSLAEKYFGNIAADNTYKKEEFYNSKDIISKSATLYRDVKQSMLVLAWIVPGARERYDYVLDVLAWILGLGKASRLHRLLVDELQLATDVEVFNYDLFDQAPFFVYVQPKDEKDNEKIIDIVQQEIKSIIEKGVSEQELLRARRQAEAQYLALLENNQKQAYVIGQSYLATGDENYLFDYLQYPAEELPKTINNLVKTYFRPSLMYKGAVLPIAQEDKDYWNLVQEQSDKEDTRILSTIKRELPVEKGMHVHHVHVKNAKPFKFPRAEKFSLTNGIQVRAYHNPNIPMIELILSLKSKYFYDPDNLQGLYAFMCTAMIEGTQHYTAHEIADAIESRGMSLNISPGSISLSMLSRDLEIGLELLYEILTQAIFEEKAIEKIRSQIIAELKNYWDSPTAFISQLARDQVYKNHPYAKKMYGDFDSVSAITRNDVLHAYKKFITPSQAIIAIVGDIAQYDIAQILERYLGVWQGPIVAPVEFPPLKLLESHTINYPMNRDQVVLGYTGLSISRYNKNFDKLLLFDQIFAGGVLGSMSSRLFQLREQSGLFYTVGGSILAQADEQPGMIFLKTIVSLDRLKEAEEALEYTINHAAQTIQHDELIEAKNALANSLVDNFATNRNIAATFLFLARFDLPDNYFDNRVQQFMQIQASEICDAARPLLSTEHLVKIRIGRMCR